jgi:hypothetical protein
MVRKFFKRIDPVNGARFRLSTRYSFATRRDHRKSSRRSEESLTNPSKTLTIMLVDS